MPSQTKDELAAENSALRERLAELESRPAGALETLRVRTQQLESVQAISTEIVREMRLPVLLELIIRHAIPLVSGANGTILLWDEGRGVLVPAAWVGMTPVSRESGIRLGDGVTGTVAIRRKGMIVNDYRTSPFARPIVLERTGITADMAEPLLYRDRLIGVIDINNGNTGRTFSDEHAEVLRLFAAQAAIAIENARTHQAALRRGEELEALLRASRTVMAGLDLQSTLDQIAAEASRIAQCKQVKLLLVDREAQALRVGVVIGLPSPLIFPCPIGHGLSGIVTQTGQPLFIADCQSDPRNLASAVDREKGLRTYLGLPVKVRGEVLGVLTFNTTEPREYSPEEMAYLTSFADQAAIAIANARLYEAAQREIAERARAEEALSRYRLLAERARDIVLFVRRGGQIVEANQAAVTTYGYMREELLTLHIRDLRAPETLALTADQMTRAEAEGILFETEHRRKDGGSFPVEVSSCGTTLDGERVLLSIIRDISERRRAEEERHRIESQMLHTQKLESLGVLAGGIAHDFNNLLVAILGYTELALLELSPASPARDHLKEIETASHRAADLCRQMLAYSGKGRFVVEPLDLSEVVREMTHMLEVAISKKAGLQYHLASQLPTIQADATQIRQVIMNLIINASEALGDQAGIIRLTTSVIRCDRAYLRDFALTDELAEGDYVWIEVSDTGCGMDERTRARIFDPFFSTKFAGRGLGLAAVLGIVRGHKGTVKVYSEIGKGTTFKLLFPASAASTDQLRPVPPAVEEWQGKGLMLLVDDEASVREIGQKLLERLGFTVIIAPDGRQAVEIFRERASDITCVLLDLTMPEMDGEETFRELRRLRSDVRVVLSSGYSQQDVTQRFAGKRLAGFIQKPYSLKQLRRTLQRVIEDAEPFQEEIANPPV